MSSTRTQSDVARETRWLAAFIIPFLALAFAILFGFPDETGRLFAWEIKPPMTAMMLGSAYAGGVWFFGRALRAGRWAEIKAGFPAVATFASLLGVATILHWDRFNHAAPAFWAWAILYFTTPFLVVGTWLRQRRLDAERRFVVDVMPSAVLSPAIRWAFAAVGFAMVAIAAGLFLAPSVVGTAWPWTLTPLTTRVMAAMFALPGIVGLGIAADPRWVVARFVIEAQVVSIALILVAAVRDAVDIRFGVPAAWFFVGGLAVFEILLVGLLVRLGSGTPAGSRTPATV